MENYSNKYSGSHRQWDSEEIGNKYTHCDWGTCSDRAEYFPDPFMHVWPYDYPDRVALIDRPRCPMDKRTSGHHSGCFYHCRMFKGPRPTPEEALEIYDDAIRQLPE